MHVHSYISVIGCYFIRQVVEKLIYLVKSHLHQFSHLAICAKWWRKKVWVSLNPLILGQHSPWVVTHTLCTARVGGGGMRWWQWG